MEVVVAEVAVEAMKEIILHPNKMMKAMREMMEKKGDSRKVQQKLEIDHTRSSRNTRSTRKAERVFPKIQLIRKKQRRHQLSSLILLQRNPLIRFSLMDGAREIYFSEYL